MELNGKTAVVTGAANGLGRELAQAYSLCGYDAVHLASALNLNDLLRADGIAPLMFISADGTLLQKTSKAGLSIDNPSNYA